MLDEYFSPDLSEDYEGGFVDGPDVFEHIDPHPYIEAQDSAESEETCKGSSNTIISS